jgi:hypothetical protein
VRLRVWGVMGKVVAFDGRRAFSGSAALERMRAIWVDGNYVPSAYAIDRMVQRGFDDQDIAYLLFETGRVASRRKVDGLWRYKVSGKSVDGRRMAAVFEIQGNFMELVTAHDR